MAVLRRSAAGEVALSSQGETLDSTTLAGAMEIIQDVRSDPEASIRKYAEAFGERGAGEPIALNRDELEASVGRIDRADRELLERTCARIRSFALAQRKSLEELAVAIPGGEAGHTIVPIERAGCYAPGGRYPLPSSMLMTVATARAAECDVVVAATPNPGDLMLAAAAIAGADVVLAIGGAHAIAALAYGTPWTDPVDFVCGPGNRWVTAAKRLVFGDVGVDMLAGPSELLVVADDTASPAVVAADLLAQAEHDDDARPFLVTTSASIADAVDAEIERQLETLPTRDTAARALRNGGSIVAASLDEAIDVVNRLAPEHLELHVRDADGLAARIRHAGAIFIGSRSAEVFGDYGFGPNHTLPTGGAARARAGLSVFDFLRPRTWLRLGPQGDDQALADAARLATLEGLEGHRRAGMIDRR